MPIVIDNFNQGQITRITVKSELHTPSYVLCLHLFVLLR